MFILSKQFENEALYMSLQILESFVPELLERREADLRRQRAAAKLQAQLKNIMPEGEGR